MSAIFEGAALAVAWRPFRRRLGRRGVWEGVRASKNPPIFIALVEGWAALLGILIAAVGTFVASYFKEPRYDGAASVLIGVVVAGLGFALVKETKDLLIGERAESDLTRRLVTLAEEQEGVEKVNGALTTHLSPEQIVAILSLEFDDDLRTPEIEKAVEDIERRVCSDIPEVVALYVKPQTAHRFRHARSGAFGMRESGVGEEAPPDGPKASSVSPRPARCHPAGLGGAWGRSARNFVGAGPLVHGAQRGRSMDDRHEQGASAGSPDVRLGGRSARGGGAPTAEQLRRSIDGDETGDRVDSPDPAAVPLGADDEAGGDAPSLAERAAAQP